MSPVWSRVFPGLTRHVADARHFVASLLEGEPLELITDVTLVVGELAANAVQHTRSGRPGGRFEVHVERTHTLIRLQVIDQGGDSKPLIPLAGPDAEGGRGLFLVTACTKEWGVEDRSRGERMVWADLTRMEAC